jgi:hypothetical protein
MYWPPEAALTCFDRWCLRRLPPTTDFASQHRRRSISFPKKGE